MVGFKSKIEHVGMVLGPTVPPLVHDQGLIQTSNVLAEKSVQSEEGLPANELRATLGIRPPFLIRQSLQERIGPVNLVEDPVVDGF
jgi:hypothetical protein